MRETRFFHQFHAQFFTQYTKVISLGANGVKQTFDICSFTVDAQDQTDETTKGEFSVKNKPIMRHFKLFTNFSQE
ncbi:hypothetical protein L6164_028611 [Bauhinia variegata]|uniref:Uncharacterized protein n=1 Tax=Bauhinia variegata TaxID=167791 RepID=A0ACB9L6I2_BAUVA|nr:hypothetical protein L6164_028611 [Bauhinia variegata]